MEIIIAAMPEGLRNLVIVIIKQHSGHQVKQAISLIASEYKVGAQSVPFKKKYFNFIGV